MIVDHRAIVGKRFLIRTVPEVNPLFGDGIPKPVCGVAVVREVSPSGLYFSIEYPQVTPGRVSWYAVDEDTNFEFVEPLEDRDDTLPPLDGTL